MDHAGDQALVRTILEHGTDLPWTLQGIGLLALRLDHRREHRLHVWDPDGATGEPPIHDHPYDFTSTVIVGEIVNACYREDASGDVFRRERYAMVDEDVRRTDTVRLARTATTYGPGEQYHQRADELHASHQISGTVTVIRCDWHDRPELTVCLRPDAPWVSGRSRPAPADEVERIIATALERFDRQPARRSG